MKEHRTPGQDRANHVKWKSDTLHKTMGRLRVIKSGIVGLLKGKMPKQGEEKDLTLGSSR